MPRHRRRPRPEREERSHVHDREDPDAAVSDDAGGIRGAGGLGRLQGAQPVPSHQRIPGGEDDPESAAHDRGPPLWPGARSRHPPGLARAPRQARADSHPMPGRDSEPAPDRCVVRGKIADYERHPGPGDIALVVEIADASLADDHQLALEVYGPAGIRVCWIVDVNARRVEVSTRRGPEGYGPPELFVEGPSVPVVIRGRVVGRIAVKDILPPRRRRAKPGGNRSES